MIIELEAHLGWETVEVEAATVEAAAYAAVRAAHPFLTDYNHTWQAGERRIHWGGEEVIFHSVRIYRNAKSEVESPYRGPPALATDYWFAVPYRTRPSVASP